ncbi:MAG: efflux RND transporter periplasmic adaptor subunit [Desulfobacterales bacterium]|nr:efflux RND transporter periplasmic adaptor subunit [Desulfobacterales bacterium]
MRRPMKYILTALGLGLALLAGCSQNSTPASQGPPPPPTVTVALPLAKDIIPHAYFSGKTQALKRVDIRARVEGTVAEIHFTPGTVVKKGDLLFSLDDRPYRIRLAQALADLKIQEAALELAQATLLRKEDAFKDKAVSEVEVLQAKAETARTRAAVDAAQAKIRNAKLNLSYTRITAPITGRISRETVDEGNLVGANERTLLAVLLQDDPIHILFSVSERELLDHITRSRPLPSPVKGHIPIMVGVAGRTDHPHTGTVDYIDTRINDQTGTLTIRGIVPNPQRRLIPGLYARIKIPMGEPRPALMVPDTALGRDQKGHYLLVMGDDNTVRYQSITPGIPMGTLRENKDGLSPKERVIIKGLQKVRPGGPATPILGGIPMEAATGPDQA